MHKSKGFSNFILISVHENILPSKFCRQSYDFLVCSGYKKAVRNSEIICLQVHKHRISAAHLSASESNMAISNPKLSVFTGLSSAFVTDLTKLSCR